MQHLIHRRSGGSPALSRKQRSEMFRFFAPALEARPMAGGERGRLVEKE
jgi:hypothetical protein